MIYKVSDNIISPLGFSSIENYNAIKQGKTELNRYENKFDILEPFVASLLNREEVADTFASIDLKQAVRYTILEQIAILSVYKALKNSDIKASAKETLFVVSTTKGNVELLEKNEFYEKERVHLWRSAQLIAQFFQNSNEPVVVSNACISGVAAQLVAERNLKAGRFKHVIVVGVDVLSKFIISGFQSFKALSPERCKPFDINRTGLNLGEAAATIIYTFEENNAKIPKNAMLLKGGAICNDANHISGPSRTGEGLFNAISETIPFVNQDDIAFINAHGTATPYNDDMEAVAMERAKLNHIPMNSLKGYFGHTLGAAGLLETVISSYALNENTILKSMGFNQLGVSSPVNVCAEYMTSPHHCFIKLVSGFGGANAAIAMQKKSI